MNKAFLIDYEIFDADNIILKKGQIKVKNKMSEFDAKCSLEVYLQKKYHNFDGLIITRCDEITETFLGDVTGFDNFMNGMFGKK